MREFLLGVMLAALIVLWVRYDQFSNHIDALQLQINLLSGQVDRQANCSTGIAVLVPGEDFYHPNTAMICQH
jgi:hypothetical protein